MNKTSIENEKSKVDFGIKSKDNNEIIESLTMALANLYALYFNTLSCHWNIVDPRFLFLHEMLQKQYEQIVENADEIAERIRQMGKKVPVSFHAFNENSDLEIINENEEGDEMLLKLATMHEKMFQDFRALTKTSEHYHDFGLVDLLGGHIRFHEKTAWIIRSHL